MSLLCKHTVGQSGVGLTGVATGQCGYSVVIVGSYVQCQIPGLMMISNPKHAAITYAPQYRG